MNNCDWRTPIPQQTAPQDLRSCPCCVFNPKRTSVERVMSDPPKARDGESVRKWLERRLEAAKLDQAAADRRGYEARDDYDKAAAEEWVCRALNAPGCTNEQAALAQRLKELIAQDEYRVTGIHDDDRFERYVRSHLRKLVKMNKANEGFEKTHRYQ
jgi:hypothetical protein